MNHPRLWSLLPALFVLSSASAASGASEIAEISCAGKNATGFYYDTSGTIVAPYSIQAGKHGACFLLEGAGAKKSIRLLGSDDGTAIAVFRAEGVRVEPPLFFPAAALHAGFKANIAYDRKRIAETEVTELPRANSGPVEIAAIALKPSRAAEKTETGPVFAADGRLIGLVVAPWYKPHTSFVFRAVTADAIQAAADEILKYGYVRRPFFGIHFDEVDSGVRLVIRGFVSGNTAEPAGLKVGDALVGLSGKEIRDVYSLRLGLRRAIPGVLLRFRIERNGKILEVDVTPGEIPGK